MNFIRIGKLIDNHGMNGEVKILPITDNPEIFYNIDFIMLSDNGNVVKSFDIEYMEESNQYLLCKLSKVNSIDEAKTLKGLDIVIPENMLPKPNKNEVYWKDIQGSVVLDTDGKRVGILKDYIESGSSDVFMIENSKGNELLISNNSNHVLEINVQNKQIIINKEGLVYNEL